MVELYCVTVCPTVYPFVHTLLANVHTSDSLVWYEASGFCYSINTRTPFGYPVVALCHGDPAALALQDQPLQTLQHFIDGADGALGLLKVLGCG